MSERGTEVALFDYAQGNRNILGNNSFIAVPSDRVFDSNILHKFEQNFHVFLYVSQGQLHEFVEQNKIDLIYKIISGGEDTAIFHDKIPHFMHCVFSTKSRHGTFYSPISPFLNIWYRTSYPVLPHIVKKFHGSNQTFRDELGIPHDAVVFGGYGAEDKFDIPFVHEAIVKVAKKRNNIYFLFMNFKSFIDVSKENIIFLPKNTDMEYKETFINTCDAMIHARSDGETFGLSVAEFSVKNKPIITWSPIFFNNTKLYLKSIAKKILRKNYIYAKAHLGFLGEKAIRYTSERDLIDIFLNFREKYFQDINYDCYSELFSEEKVMRIFEAIYSKVI